MEVNKNRPSPYLFFGPSVFSNSDRLSLDLFVFWCPHPDITWQKMMVKINYIALLSGKKKRLLVAWEVQVSAL